MLDWVKEERKKKAVTVSIWEYFLEETFMEVPGSSLICSHSASLCFQGVLAQSFTRNIWLLAKSRLGLSKPNLGFPPAEEEMWLPAGWLQVCKLLESRACLWYHILPNVRHPLIARCAVHHTCGALPPGGHNLRVKTWKESVSQNEQNKACVYLDWWLHSSTVGVK